MLSSMMRSLVKKELSAMYTILKKVNVYTIRKEKKLYNCCILNGSGCEDFCEDTGEEVIYTLNENCVVDMLDHTISQYGSCNVDVIKPRWVFMADNGYKIKETIKFQFESARYVRMVVHISSTFNGPQGDISRIEFAFGKITFGVSYILPFYVWEQRCEEIKDIFTDRKTGPSVVIPVNLDWDVVATFEQYA